MKQNRIINSIKVASFCGMMVLTATSCSDDFFDVKTLMRFLVQPSGKLSQMP